jgi:hypothetical protein
MTLRLGNTRELRKRKVLTPVFVSHAGADKVTTAAICDALNVEGIPTWGVFSGY